MNEPHDTEEEGIPLCLSKGLLSNYMCVLMQIVFMPLQKKKDSSFFLEIQDKMKSLTDIYPESCFVMRQSINKSVRRRD